MKLNQFPKTLFDLFLIAAVSCVLLAANPSNAFAQFAFMGDYDRGFNAPNGYYVEPENNDPTISGDPARSSVLFTGELNPDGSIIAGGRILRGEQGDFWLRKFTASGAVDASFGNGAGAVRTIFYPNPTQPGANENSLPQVLKRQPDGKILFAGRCSSTPSNAANNSTFGNDVCLLRYNPDGTLDQGFGNNSITVGGASSNYSFQPGAGKFTMQTGRVDDCSTPSSFGLQFYVGTNGTIYDIAVQPDGKIVLAGETTDFIAPFAPGCSATQRKVGILIRLNPNGSLDSSFGTNGIAKLIGPRLVVGEGSHDIYGSVRFSKVLVQPDGRIVAVGNDGTAEANAFTGTVFLVTRWTASGQLETKRRLDNNQSQAARETASGALFSPDNSKIYVSGVYPNDLALVRLNVNDLSLDQTFGAGGIRRYAVGNPRTVGLKIEAIQPDGKILGVDESFINGSRVVRLNADGSPDNSFGNASFDNTGANPRGRLSLPVTAYNGSTQPLLASRLLLRPDGKINLIGAAIVNAGQDIYRGAASQQYNVFKNGNYSDFTNDGRSDISVFRNGTWFYLDSANNSFSAAQFGQAVDRLAPADYDGDGRTDTAVFRDGTWYLLQSSKGFAAVSFGAAGDLPRPGDFDGDGRADITVFRPSNGVWYRLNSGTGAFAAVQFGQSGDAPVLGDFDADGRSDICVFRGGAWYYLRSSDGAFRAAQFGQAGDIPVAGDYDADSQTDIAVFRPSNGTWYLLRSQAGFTAAQFGANGDRPVPGDYDNDGKVDLAVFRNGTWCVIRSGDNGFVATSFGTASDAPVAAAYLP